MSKSQLTRLGAAFAAVALSAGAFPGTSQDPLLKEADLRKFGESIRGYIEASASAEAENEVKAEMDKLEKKLAKTPVAGDVLASPADLGLAYWLSYDYAKARTKKGKVEEREYVFSSFTKDNPLKYAAWAPAKYAVKDGPYPVLIFLPDEGQTPEQHITEDWVDGDLRDGLILAVPEMPADKSQWGTEALMRVMVLMRSVTESYAVDFDRIFLGGKGVGLEHAAAIADKFPDRFAGVIGRSGDLGELSADNFSNLPTYFAGAGARATAFRDAVKERGWNNCTLEPEGTEKQIWSWIQSQSRPAYPEKVVLHPGSPLPRRSAWLEVAPSEYQNATIQATIDRATNTITVEGTGVNEFVVYLNDAMLDLNKPIVVNANGQENRIQVSRTYKAFLNNIYFGRSDPARIFVASQSFHLPSK